MEFTKVCNCCNLSLPVDRFAECLKRGRMICYSLCKSCRRAKDAARYQSRRVVSIPHSRPQYYRPAKERACDEAMGGWRFVINTDAALRWAA